MARKTKRRARGTARGTAHVTRTKTKSGQPVQNATAAAPSIDTPGTLGEWLAYLGADPIDPDWIPVWPPDAFAKS